MEFPSYFFIISFFTIILTTLFLRLLYILPAINRNRPPPRKRGTPTHLLIFLGSGGHTAEMFSLLSDLDPNSYTHRTYVISSGDNFSASKAVEFERNLKPPTSPPNNTINPPPYSIHFIPRARRIHQSLLTTPLSSLHSLQASISLLLSLSPIYPDLIILNGPATSLIFLLASLLLRFCAVSGTKGKMRSIYVESWARVRGLSLSGKIVVRLGVADRVLVQWEELAKGRGGEYRGCLIR